MESNLVNGLVGVLLCLARLRSTISFASSFGVPSPDLIGLCSERQDLLGELGPNLAGENDAPPPGCVGLVGVDWMNGEGMFGDVRGGSPIGRFFVTFIVFQVRVGSNHGKAQNKAWPWIS